MTDIKANAKKAGMRQGFAILDLIIYLSLAGLAVAGIIWMSSGAKTSMEGDKLSNKATVMINGVEKAKSDYNNDTYIAANGYIPDITNLKLALGGTKATKALSGWQYSCTAGVDSTITVTSDNIKDTEIIDSVAQKVNSKYTDWTGSRSGNTLVLTRSNSNCQ